MIVNKSDPYNKDFENNTNASISNTGDYLIKNAEGTNLSNQFSRYNNPTKEAVSP